MKNEVNSALQANGNSNLSGLHREGYRMARFLLYKNSANSHSMHCNSSTAISTKSEESPSNHAVITGKSPRNHPVMAGILKHAALLLLAITLGVGEMWGWNVTEGSIYYFKPSEVWKADNARFAVAFGNSGTTYAWYSCIAVTGETDLYYVVSPGNYDWMIFCRMKPSDGTNNWDNRWNESQKVEPNSNYNRFDLKASWATDFDWYKYAPPMESATLTNNSTTYGGDGTSGNPYQIKIGSTLSVSPSATSYVSDSYTKYYQYYKKENSGSRSTWGSETSSTSAKTLTASSTAGTTYEIDVVARNEYYSNYGTTVTSSKLYFITINPIYAILGSFNSWTHSAATWDLSDQGSDNWDATFALTKGNHTFKVVYNSTYYGKTSAAITRASNSATGLSTSGDNITITADVAGDYTFRFNSSSKSLTVTYPTAYTVTYGKDAGGNSISATATSAGGSFSSGALVLSGDVVTFSQTNKDGYSFKGWYTTEAGSTSAGVNGSNQLTIDGAKTVYAQHTENLSAITIGAGSNGSVTNAGEWNLGVTTSKSSTATADAGYYFSGWSKTKNAALSSASTATTTVKGDGTNGGSGTVTANFAKRWVLRGSRDDGSTADGMPLWSTTTADMSVNGSGVSTKTVTLLPNRKYKYMIYDKKPTAAQKGCTSASEASATQGLGTEWTLNGTNPVYFSTKGYGTYTFSVRVSGDNPAVTVTGPTSYAITMGTTTWTEGTGSVGTGGTNTAKTTEASTDYAITNGQYIRSGGTAVFSATPNTGYQFMGWYNASNYNHNTNEPISTDNPYTIENITSAKTVYALFQEIVYDVTVSLDGNTTTTKKAGCVSHPSITAVVPSGKVFDRWITTGSATVASPYSKTTTITGASDNQSTVTATFKDLPKIYYCKELTTAGWTPSDMYVYFYKTGGYWNESNGSGSSTGGGQVIAGPCKMTKIAGKNIWYYEYNPEAGAFAGKTIEAVSFIDKSQSNTANFASCSGTYRGDFASCLNMFVLTSADGVTKNSSAYYRNTGYWHNYGEVNSGFYLNNLPGGSTEFVDEDGDGVFEATANLDEKTTYYFYVGGCGGWNWSNNNGSYPFNTSNRTRTLEKYDNVASDTYRCKLTTTDAGYYTFKLTPSNTAASLSITVDFPLATNDYRATITRGGKKFPSNIIKSGTSSGTISLWLDNGSNTVAIEKFNGTTWVSQVSRTVTTSKKGVYTMTLTCNGASSTLSTPEEYTGDFYIRTDCAPGNWKNYKENKLTENTLTFSEEDATTFNYYFCKWVSDAGTNVRFVVANDYNMAISDTLKGESALGGSGPGYNETLPAPANVRFSYNSYTNGVNRAYISGSSIISDRFLVMKGDTKLFNSSGQTLTSGGGGKVKGLNDYEMNFIDKNNWVYQVDVQAKSGALVYLIARYNGVDRDLYGSSSDKKTLITSTNESTKYHLTTIYDFKTNNLMTAWKPGADAINENISNVRSVMLARSHHQNAEQITIGTGSINNTTIYGVMQFSKYTLNNQSTEAGHATLSPLLSAAERSIYWISFPFDVRLKEVFGFGHYYQHWAIEYYDGAERAAKGYWIDSDSFWKLVSPAEVERGGDDGQGFILKKNVGYLLVLDLDLLGTSSSIWNNSVTDVALYFPSKDTETITNSRPTSVEVPEHNCTIDRRSDEDKENNVQNFDKDRRIADSHWNVIGVPSYANVVHLDSVAQIRVKDSEGNYFTEDYPEGFGYYYAWDPSSNTYNVSIRSTETTFKTMHAYMLQFAGTINWQEQNSSLYSAPARTNSMEDYDIHLELMKGEAKEDQTFVRFSEKEDVTAKFEFSQDITKIMNAKKANIYTLIEGYIPAGGNSLPFSETTTIIPVGVKIATNDDYTFTIPDGTDGIGVTLIDNVTGSRTNLSALDYTVSLEAGTHNERFVLEISPIHKVPTELEPSAASDSQSGARKLLIDGLLYIVRDGKMFDAQGRKISDK